MPSYNDSVVILSATRTPMGRHMGGLSQYSAPLLGAEAITSCLKQSQLRCNEIDQVIMGCVLSAGLGQAPARQAAIQAGVDLNTPCTTINKVCGSGMKSIMDAHDQIVIGNANTAIAGGMESMSNAPYLITDMRKGKSLSHSSLLDSIFTDGLEDAYEGKLMGVYAQEVADRLSISREEMDSYAARSLTNALRAVDQNLFNAELYPVGDVLVDEIGTKEDLANIHTLKPVFKKHGTITAANSSSISDGAAAVCLTNESFVSNKKITPLARIIAHTTYASKPGDYPLAPSKAIEKLFTKIGWGAEYVDLYEINEAFAVVPILTINQLRLDIERVNINGGACALGHPLGCSGARIVVTLLHALRARGLHRGVAAICIGGGEATALAIEIM